VLKLPPARATATIASKDKPTSVIINPVMETHIFSPEERPRRGGKIILPAPKKTAKSNKLIESICAGFKVVRI